MLKRVESEVYLPSPICPSSDISISCARKVGGHSGVIAESISLQCLAIADPEQMSSLRRHAGGLHGYLVVEDFLTGCLSSGQDRIRRNHGQCGNQSCIC